MVYLHVPFLDLSVLDVLPQVVADGAEGGVNLDTEVAPESYRSFILRHFLYAGSAQSYSTVFLNAREEILGAVRDIPVGSPSRI